MCEQKRMEGRLLLILLMWHFANLISLACNGQPAQIDTVCACVCMFASLCLGVSWPVNATTLADGSNNGIREKVKAIGRNI